MSARIEDLEPVTRALCVDFLRACESDLYSVRITHTLRSMDEQMHLYAKGRTLRADGKWLVIASRLVVTNAAPGSSAHNFGAAFDFCWQGADPYLSAYRNERGSGLVDPRWERVGILGERLGLVWGGRWKSIKDRPHFERADWRSLKGDG